MAGEKGTREGTRKGERTGWLKVERSVIRVAKKRDADKARSDRLFLYLPSVDLHKDQCRLFLRF